ncbi:MAG TPA: hypothetical protein V6C85_29970 [Allocoleopsis sp.]
MAVAFFQVQLSVQTKEHGQAELVVAEVLQKLNYQFVIVKEGGKEGIIKVEDSEENLQKIEQNQSCKKLTESQIQTLKESYPTPKIKQKYRLATPEGSETEQSNEPFAVDESGARLVDTWQTVRSGFYLIDVPILTQP